MKFSSLLFLLLTISSSQAEIKAPYIMPSLLSVTKAFIPQALWEGKTEEKWVALSFDDGPSQFTLPLLDVLKEENVAATFFVLGTRINVYPNTVRRMQREGHLIALHGSEHVNLHGKSESWLLDNINREKAALKKIVGNDALPQHWFFRPPFGAVSPRIIRTIESTNTRVVMCTILPGQQGLMPDKWEEKPEVTVARVLRNISPGGIISLHDGEDRGLNDHVFSMPQAPETARSVIRALKREGYQFKRIDQLPDPSRKSYTP